jgi:hypothetical protein
MLTLAFPYTPEIAGSVLCYTLTPELAEAWEELTKRHTTEGKNLPYADVAQALRFVLGDFAAIRRGPKSKETLVLTRRQPPEGLIARLFGQFELDLARRHKLPFQDRLAPLLTDLRPTTLRVGDYLGDKGTTGEPDLPKWVYDVATWHAVELLAARPLHLPSGRRLRLRADTDGNLLAWEDLLPADTGERRREPAMHYLSLSAVTLPGYHDLVLSIDAHVSRLTHFFGNARTVWIAADPNRLVLTSGFRYDRATKQRSLAGIAGQLVDSFSLRGIPELHDDILAREPARVRARYHSTPTSHPVGSGPGRKFLDVVLDHVRQSLPDGGTALELVDSKIRGIDRPDGARADAEAPHDRVRLADTLDRSQQRLDLTVLFATDRTRARAASAIAHTLDSDLEAIDEGSSTTEVIPGHLKVTFTHVPTDHLLTPGEPAARIKLAQDVASKGADGWISAVLAETSRAAACADGVPRADDPKRQGRRAHARHGTVAQHLDTDSAPSSRATDHPARNALLDLLRAAGLAGTLPRRVFNPPLTPQPVVIVGIYSREQYNPTRRMVSLAALVTDGTDAPWQTLGYHPDAGGWSSYREANLAHHATAISPFRDTLGWSARIQAAGDYTRRALNQLLLRYSGWPMVLLVDGVGGRTVWSGLANRQLGYTAPGALPHLDLANADDLQVGLVRVITNDDDVLVQPVRATVKASLATEADDEGDDTDAFVPASTKLYRLAGSCRDVYYLVNRSRTDQAYDFDVKASHRKTRFDIADNPRTLATAWHAMTCTEFTVLDAARWSSDQLAALAARLCGHPLAWDGRTSFPIPVHLARQVIDDHPDRT